MLLDLYVKNLALIEKVHVEFGEGLNILTGETGAGKSIIIGSVNIALGGKVPKDVIRQGADYAYIELIFSVPEQERRKRLEELDVILPEDGTLIISRKIMPSRSVSRINDETVTAAKLRQITSLLLDIHGQHEHQSLLYQSKHLEILDTYAKSQIQPILENVSEYYHQYIHIKEQLEHTAGDKESRLREADFLRFEIEEMEQADLKEGEEEELTAQYRKISNSRKIMEGITSAYEAVSTDAISQALREVGYLVEYDDNLKGIQNQLYDLDSILSDVSHEMSAYMENMTFDEERFQQIEERLDLIHNLQAKYGNTIEQIYKNLEDKKKRLDQLENYDQIQKDLESRLQQTKQQLEQLCRELSEQRHQASESLVKSMRKGLSDLNFIDVKFEMEFRKLEHFTAKGLDEAEFMISTNPGEPVKPLGMVASGGELSRVMLAIKAVLADSDEIPTLIFDEIDTGISGRTAQKVSEKLAYIANTHQVICITHLPQIASMADRHYEIAKETKEGRTVTQIHLLDEHKSIEELARMLGGAKITESVLQNAREMKELARNTGLITEKNLY